jgi:hypothetical protein
MPKAVECATMVVGNGQARRERLGICLTDLDRIAPLIRQCLRLADHLDVSRDSVVWVDKSRFDEACIPFICDLLTAACICDTIRSHDRRAGDYPTRVYLKRVAAWEKLAGGVQLSVVKNEKVMLNPELFPPVPQAGSAEPPRLEAIQFKTR